MTERLTTTKKREPKLFEGLDGINENQYFIKIANDPNVEDFSKVANKLGQHEDIEENLGFDLVTLSKAIKGIKRRSVYNVEKKSHVFVNTIIYYENDLIIKGYDEDSVFLVKDYGKTWR